MEQRRLARRKSATQILNKVFSFNIKLQHLPLFNAKALHSNNVKLFLSMNVEVEEASE